MRKLYLDDIRNPTTKGWDIVRSYEEFVDYVTKNGVPDMVSFDHDLGVEEHQVETKTGYDVAKWLCDYCYENGLPLPEWNVHSANPVGRDNIISVLKSFEKKLN